MPGLDWLTARPIAHRGLHDAVSGIIENTPSAIAAAVAANYAIEVDLQISADGEAMVHHDAVLGRLTDGEGRLDTMTAADLKRVAFKETSDHMMALSDLMDLVRGRVALFLELKSRFDGDITLARCVAQGLQSYSGPVAVMSFDPRLVEAIQGFAPGLPRGIVAERYSRRGDPGGSGGRKRLAYLLHVVRSRPHFLAYHVKDLPATAPLVARHVLGMPLLTWTVRSEDDRRRAARFADQMIFEGFRP
jgi:glycerophosphoryl diester phosphodiesterase